MLRQATSDKSLDGLYHYCDADAVSWFDFARQVFSVAYEVGLLQKIPELSAVDSADFPQKATRPGYSVLDVSRAEKAFGIVRPGLRTSLYDCLGELKK